MHFHSDCRDMTGPESVFEPDWCNYEKIQRNFVNAERARQEDLVMGGMLFRHSNGIPAKK